MLAKDLHPRKAPYPMVFTDSGIATLTTWWQSSKAPAWIWVREVWDVELEEAPLHGLPLLLQLQLRFYSKLTVTSDSSCNSPADSSVWSASTSNPPSARTFTLRILMLNRDLHNVLLFMKHYLQVFYGGGRHDIQRWRSPPSKVFTFSSHCMTAMAGFRGLRRNHFFDAEFRLQDCWIATTKFMEVFQVNNCSKPEKKELIEGIHLPFTKT